MTETLQIGFRVFLDANVLSKPVTRTLIMAAGAVSGYGVSWSAAVENEASRHMRPGQKAPSAVRILAGGELSAPGVEPERFTTTQVGDRLQPSLRLCSASCKEAKSFLAAGQTALCISVT